MWSFSEESNAWSIDLASIEAGPLSLLGQGVEKLRTEGLFPFLFVSTSLNAHTHALIH